MCSICKTPIPNATESAFSRHVKAEHADVLATSKSEEEKTGVIQRLWAATRSAGEGFVYTSPRLIGHICH